MKQKINLDHIIPRINYIINDSITPKEILNRIYELELVYDGIAIDQMEKSDLGRIIIVEFISLWLQCDSNFDGMEAIMELLGIKPSDLSFEAAQINSIIAETTCVSTVKRFFELGCNIKANNNIVKQAVYGNKIETAIMLLELGHKVPEKISLFSIANQLSWDPVRLLFLLSNGTKLEFTEKERKCLCVIMSQLVKDDPTFFNYMMDCISEEGVQCKLRS